MISFRLDQTGARKFGHHEQERPPAAAIVLDGKVIAPPSTSRLPEAAVSLPASSPQETQDLALLLRAGVLPAPVSFQRRTVGPGLGMDPVEAGKVASLIGLLLVIIFMVVVYGRFGLMADVALLGHRDNIRAAICTAGDPNPTRYRGIVLNMGMAVDANVLIFERIREETHAGRGPIASIDAGYRRALTTIIDSNPTTLIAAVLLFAFGSDRSKALP